MQTVEWPGRTCREQFWKNEFTSVSCDVPEMHDGPHASFADPASVARRDQWEAAQGGSSASAPDPFEADRFTSGARPPVRPDGDIDV